jgi:hypothetical protein
MLDYYIIGTTHLLQEKPAIDTSLRDKLAEIASKRHIVLIAEETLPETQTYGRELADSQNPIIPWLPMDMTQAEKESAGIADDLDAALQLNEAAHYSCQKIEHYPQRAHAVREASWLNKIQATCKANQITKGTILITCGRLHSESLANRARNSGIKTIKTIEWPSGLMKQIGKIKTLP